LIKETCRPFSI